MSFAKFENQGDIETIRYAHTSAVVAWTPIRVTGIGVLVPVVSADANVETTYYTEGLFKANITDGVTVSQFDQLYYITATGKVTNVDPTTSGFLVGVAVNAGTAVAGYVDLDLFKYPLSAQISKEHLDSGILPSHIVVFAGSFAAGGTQSTETKTIATALSTDLAFFQIKTAGGDTSAVIRTSTTADGSISCVLSTPMGSGSPVIKYQVLRAVS